MDVYVSVLIDLKVTGKIIQCWGVVQVPSVGKQDDMSDIKKKKNLSTESQNVQSCPYLYNENTQNQ